MISLHEDFDGLYAQALEPCIARVYFTSGRSESWPMQQEERWTTRTFIVAALPEEP